MKRTLFRMLAWLNKMILPRMSQKDLYKLKKWEKAIVAYRYWVTINAL
jgi:hypothetical protein